MQTTTLELMENGTGTGDPAEDCLTAAAMTEGRALYDLALHVLAVPIEACWEFPELDALVSEARILVKRVREEAQTSLAVAEVERGWRK